MKLYVIKYTLEVECYSYEECYDVVEREFTARLTDFNEVQQYVSDLDMIGATRVEVDEYSMLVCLMYYIRALAVALTGGYKNRSEHFYELLRNTHCDIGRCRLAEWFDQRAFKYNKGGK